MILGLFSAGIANLAAVLAAHEITRRMSSGQAPVDWLVFLVVRLALISAAVLAGGVGGFLTPLGMGLLGTVGLVLLLVTGAHRHLRRPALPRPGLFLGILAGLAAVRILLQVWCFSPHLGDALAYHLPKIGEWIQAGRFTREMGLHPHATFPAGFELVETWWVVFLRHDLLIELAGVEFLALGFAATYALGRKLDLPEAWAFFAALLFALTPGLHLSATSCLNDAPVAALVTAVFALVACRATPSVVFLAAGLGVGVKATFLYALPGVALLAMLLRKDRAVPSPSRAGSCALVACGLILAGSWYARNLAWFGNPAYPVGQPGYSEEAVAVQAGPRLQSLLRNLGDLVESRVYDHQAPYGANVDYIAGWGPAAFAFGLPALMLAIRDDGRWRRLAAAYAVSLGSCCLLMVHDPWCLKYVFFFPALLCLTAGRLAMNLRETAPFLRAALLLTFLGTMLPYDLPLRDFRVLAGQPWRGRTALVLRERAVAEASVGCFGGFRANCYLLYGPDFSRGVVYLRPSSADGLVEEMQRKGLRLLYAVPEGSGQESILTEGVSSGRLVSRGGNFYALR